MGYTHYFQQKQKPTEDGWKAFKSQIMIAFEKFQKSENVLICDGHGEIAILNPTELFAQCESGEYLCFNGHDEDSHESFFMTSYSNPEFNFCKTARKPYDLFAMISLVLAHHYMPNCHDIGSDGNDDEWCDAFNWISVHLTDDEDLLQLTSFKQLKS